MLALLQVVPPQELHLALQPAHLHQVQVVQAQPPQLTLAVLQVALVQEPQLVQLAAHLHQVQVGQAQPPQLMLALLQEQALEPQLVQKVMALKA